MAISAAWETLKHAIEAYTGLSAATFFTAVAVAAALYYAVAGLFAPPPPPPPRRLEVETEVREVVQLGEVSEEDLKAYDGTDEKKPLLMAIKGQIYDVTQSRMFYGPGGPYALFAGRDASRALAKMSFEPQDLTSDISGLGPFELDALQDWEYKFMSKYAKVGTVKKTIPVSDGSDENTREQTEKAAEGSENAHQDAKPNHSEEVKDLKVNALSGESEVADHTTESKESVEGKGSED